MELEEAIMILKDTKVIDIYTTNYDLDLNDYKQAIETVLQELENSIPKNIIGQKIIERQFELQQEYKDFEDDIRLNTLQEIYYLNDMEE